MAPLPTNRTHLYILASISLLISQIRPLSSLSPLESNIESKTTKHWTNPTIPSKTLIDMTAQNEDENFERHLVPRKIQDDQKIKRKHKRLSKKRTELKSNDEEIGKSIWDMGALYGDLETGKPDVKKAQPVNGLISDMKVLNSRLNTVAKKMGDTVELDQSKLVKYTGSVLGVPSLNSLHETILHTQSAKSEQPQGNILLSGKTTNAKKLDLPEKKKVASIDQSNPKTTNIDTKDQRKAMTVETDVVITKVIEQGVQDLKLFDNYQIRKRYTLDPEEDLSKVELIEMPRRKKFELVVGILTLPISKILKKKIRKHIKSKIPAAEYMSYDTVLADMTFYPTSYAKWLEHNGVKTVPLSINHDLSTIYDIIDKLDGLLLTGGATPLFLKNNIIQIDREGTGSYMKIKHPSDYLKIVKKIVSYAKQKNLQKPFPVWGTCLGFEAILLDESNLSVNLNFVHNNNKNLPNHLLPRAKQESRLVSFLSPEAQQIFETTNSSFFNHDYAFVLKHVMKNSIIEAQYRIISSVTVGATEVVSGLEHKTLPIYGVQFHPEKILYENSSDKVVKTDAAKRLSNDFSMFFVSGTFTIYIFIY